MVLQTLESACDQECHIWLKVTLVSVINDEGTFSELKSDSITEIGGHVAVRELCLDVLNGLLIDELNLLAWLDGSNEQLVQLQHFVVGSLVVLVLAN